MSTRQWKIARMMLAGLCGTPVLTIGNASEVSGTGSLTLVKDGRAMSVIVIATNPTVSAQLGAKELQWHVQQMTGAEIPITNETTVIETDRVKLYIGDTKKAAEHRMNQAQFTNQEHAIRWIPGGVVFAGKDKDDYRALRYDAENPTKLANLPELFDERGSADAVYDFLEQACGIRWLAAAKTGSVIPKMKTLKVVGADRRFKASFDMRDVSRMLYEPETCMWTMQTPEWNRYYAAAWPGGFNRNLGLLYSMRWHNGGVPMAANHSLYGYYDRFCEASWKERYASAGSEKARQDILKAKTNVFEKDRPEFFAKGYENKAVPPQLCYSSTALVAQVARDARDYYAGKKVPGYAWSLPNPFVIEPMDNSAFCQCASCRQWRDTNQVYKGFNNGLNSDYHFQFVNAVARELKKTHPGKPIITLAYATHAAVPGKVKLEPTIHVQYCWSSNRGWGGASTNDKQFAILKDWVAEAGTSGRDLSLWMYNTFPRENGMVSRINIFPGFFAHRFARQLKDVKARGFKGINHCGWGQDVENYIGFRLMYDVNLDVETLLDEYFNGLYGAAAAPMKQMYVEMEQVYGDPNNYTVKPDEVGDITDGNKAAVKKQVTMEERSWRYLGSPERMARWQTLLNRAKSLAQDEREKQNIQLFELAIWSYMKAGSKMLSVRNRLGEIYRKVPAHLLVPKLPDDTADGDPVRVDWTCAQGMDNFHTIYGDETDKKLHVGLTYDRAYLYVRLEDASVRAPYVDGDSWTVSFARKHKDPRGHWCNPLPRSMFIIAPSGRVDAAGQGRVQAIQRIKSDTATQGRWTLLLAFRLDKVMEGGLAAGNMFYGNFFRNDVATGETWSWRSNLRSGDVAEYGKLALDDATLAPPLRVGDGKAKEQFPDVKEAVLNSETVSFQLLNMANDDALQGIPCHGVIRDRDEWVVTSFVLTDAFARSAPTRSGLVMNSVTWELGPVPPQGRMLRAIRIFRDLTDRTVIKSVSFLVRDAGTRNYRRICGPFDDSAPRLLANVFRVNTAVFPKGTITGFDAIRMEQEGSADIAKAMAAAPSIVEVDAFTE